MKVFLRFSAPIAALFLVACGSKEPEIVMDPVALEQAFKDAPAEVRQQADQSARALQQQDAVAAFNQLHQLQQRPGLTPTQQMEAGRAFVANLRRVQEAAERGDSRAKQTMERYRASK